MIDTRVKKIILKPYSVDKSEQWDNFIEKSKNGLFIFKRKFMDYHSDRYKDNSLIFYEGDKILAILPLSIKNDELSSHDGLTYGGFIVSESMKQNKMLKCFKLLLNYMQSKDISKLYYKCIPYIYHKLPSEEDLYSLYRFNAKVLKIEPSCVVFLNKSIKMPKGRISQINRAKRNGIVIEQSEDFDSFIKLENYVLKKYHNATAVHTSEELKLLKSRFKDEIQLWIATLDGKMIAGAVLFVYENTVHTQYLASDETSRKLGGLDLLIKTLIDKFSTNKLFFDFGISTENSGLFLNKGLIFQKESFGARVVCYQTWEINCEKYVKQN